MRCPAGAFNDQPVLRLDGGVHAADQLWRVRSLLVPETRHMLSPGEPDGVGLEEALLGEARVGLLVLGGHPQLDLVHAVHLMSGMRSTLRLPAR